MSAVRKFIGRNGPPSLVGRWVGEQEKDGMLVFHEDGEFEILDANGNPTNDGGPQPTGTWETITEVEPHQLYLTLRFNGDSARIPFGIYKIQNGKLILRPSEQYQSTLGGIHFGKSRFDLPKDFFR